MTIILLLKIYIFFIIKVNKEKVEGKVMTFEELMKCNKLNEDRFNDLMEKVLANAIVPFFGSGFSASAVGYPTWKELLLDLAEEQKQEVQNEISQMLDGSNCDFEQAATKLCEKYGENNFRDRIQTIFSPNNLKNKDIPKSIKLIVDVFKNTIVTTNYDKVIEKIYRDNGVNIDIIEPKDPYTSSHSKQSLQQSDQIIIKLHGDIRDKKNFIITLNDYNEAYGKNEIDLSKPLPQILSKILKSKIILFLGCGLQSDRMLKVLDKCNENATYYALVELPDNDEKFLERDYYLGNKSIRRIWYPYQQHKEALEVFLSEIYSRKKKRI